MDKNLQRIQRLRLIDDDFMRVIFANWECTEFLLRTVMEIPSLKVKSLETQMDLKNLQGRSLRLDITATDQDGKLYNVEVQRNEKGAVPKRARYHNSLLDAHSLKEGQDFEALPELYIIFIMEKDPLGAGYPLYHVDRCYRELPMPFQDEAHIIYVNTDVPTDGALGDLAHDFLCENVDEMRCEVLAQQVRYYKKDAKGVSNVSAIFEEVRQEGRQEGLQEGRQEGRQEGLDAGNIRSLVELIKATGWELSHAMDVLRVPEDKRAYYEIEVMHQLKLA